MWLKATEVNLNDIKRVPSNQYRYVQGMNIAYKDIPGEHVLFCIPGWPTSSTVYMPLALALDNNVRLIAIDLPGWGGFSDKPRFKPTTHNYAELIADFINSFHVDDYSVLGYSFGGALLQATLATGKIHPQKAVFVSTLHNGYELSVKFGKMLKLYRWARSVHLPSRLIKKITESYIRIFRRGNLDRYYDKWDDTLIYKQTENELMRADVDSMFGVMFSLLDDEMLTPKLAETQSMVVYADSDPDFIKRESKEMANFLEVEPIYLEGMDHNHIVFDVNKSADVILNFLLA